MKLLVIVICVTFSLLTMVVADTVHQATTHEIEVYRVVPALKTVIMDDIEVEVNLSTDSVKFPSGLSCKYSSGYCYHYKINKPYRWQIEDTLCDSLVPIYKTSYDFQRGTLVLLDNGSVITLILTKEEQVCGGLWRTNYSDLVVAVGHKIKSTDSESYLQDNFEENVEMRDIQNEINKLKEENARLKDNLNSVQYQLELNNIELIRLSDIVKQLISDKHLAKRSTDEATNDETNNSFTEPLFNSVCSNSFLFPCEKMVLAFVIISYIMFSVINTMMNYTSLRMLRIKTDNSIIFYSLTQGLATRYMCRTMGLTKMKVDKWLLDIETPLK